MKKTAKEYAETRDRIIDSQLSDIQDIVNDKMKEITVKIVRDKNLIPPRLNLEKINSYYDQVSDCAFDYIRNKG